MKTLTIHYRLVGEEKDFLVSSGCITYPRVGEQVVILDMGLFNVATCILDPVKEVVFIGLR